MSVHGLVEKAIYHCMYDVHTVCLTTKSNGISLEYIAAYQQLAERLVEIEKSHPEVVAIILSAQDKGGHLQRAYPQWFTYRAKCMNISFVQQNQYFNIIKMFG